MHIYGETLTGGWGCVKTIRKLTAYFMVSRERWPKEEKEATRMLEEEGAIVATTTITSSSSGLLEISKLNKFLLWAVNIAAGEKTTK